MARSDLHSIGRRVDLVVEKKKTSVTTTTKSFSHFSQFVHRKEKWLPFFPRRRYGNFEGASPLFLFFLESRVKIYCLSRAGSGQRGLGASAREARTIAMLKKHRSVEGFSLIGERRERDHIFSALALHKLPRVSRSFFGSARAPVDNELSSERWKGSELSRTRARGGAKFSWRRLICSSRTSGALSRENLPASFRALPLASPLAGGTAAPAAAGGHWCFLYEERRERERERARESESEREREREGASERASEKEKKKKDGDGFSPLLNQKKKKEEKKICTHQPNLARKLLLFFNAATASTTGSTTTTTTTTTTSCPIGLTPTTNIPPMKSQGSGRTWSGGWERTRDRGCSRKSS